MLLSDFAFEFGDEVEQEADQAEGGFSAIEGLQAKAIRRKVLLELLDTILALGAAVMLGRDIQRAYRVPEQAILTVPLLPGTDGVRRMSKSLRNYIGVTDPPEDIYGKTLRIPDEALGTWYRLLLGHDPPSDLGPRDAKRWLAHALVARFHGEDAAVAAEREFDRVHIQRQAPDEMPTVTWPADRPEVHLPALLAGAFGISTSEARRNLAQGGVKLNGEPVGNGSLDLPAADVDGKVLGLGKRRFARVRVE